MDWNSRTTWHASGGHWLFQITSPRDHSDDYQLTWYENGYEKVGPPQDGGKHETLVRAQRAAEAQAKVVPGPTLRIV